jgi:hypothetical protein
MLAEDAYCTPQKLWKMDNDWTEKHERLGQKAISVNTMLITQICTALWFNPGFCSSKASHYPAYLWHHHLPEDNLVLLSSSSLRVAHFLWDIRSTKTNYNHGRLLHFVQYQKSLLCLMKMWGSLWNYCLYMHIFSNNDI